MSIASYVAQKERVKERLRKYGRCSYGNFDPRIRKLAGVINELQKQGWEIDTEYVGGGDRRYRLVSEPRPELRPPKGTFPGDPPPLIEPQEKLFDD